MAQSGDVSATPGSPRKQGTDPQLDTLRAAGCETVLEEHASRGMFTLQVRGAVAQLERALIAKRTKAGLKSARSHSPIGGNPGLRNGDPDAIRKMEAAGHCASGGVVA